MIIMYLFAAVFLIAGIVALIIFAKDIKCRARCTMNVLGTYEGYEKRCDTDGRHTFYSIYTAQLDGEKRTYHSHTGSNRKPKRNEGVTVELLVNPDNKEEWYVPAESSWSISLFVGLIFIGAGFMMIFVK